MPEGRRFKPGQSGNPGGRPKGLARAVRDRLREVAGEGRDGADELVSFWFSIVTDQHQKTADRIACSKILAAYGWGKPPEHVPLDDVDPLGLQDEQLEAAAREFEERVRRLASVRDRGTVAQQP
jgi:hypothetical protein